jgi:hypothetical protein
MQHDDNRGDLLLALVVGESAVALYAAYAIILLALHRIPRDQWLPSITVFLVSAVALIATSLIAGVVSRRSIKH